MDAYKFYRTDAGRLYPYYRLEVDQVNNISTQFDDPIMFLPNEIKNLIITTQNICNVRGLLPRILNLTFIDNAAYSITCALPFNSQLKNHLANQPEIKSFQFVGEKIKHSRLKRLLDNV